MKQIGINNINHFREIVWELRNETDNQIILSLLDSVEHSHAIRFPKKKIIWISNLNEKEINYLIELSPLRNSDPNGHSSNETSFYFGGADNSLYLFSNLNIKATVNEPFRFIKGSSKQIYLYQEKNMKGEVTEIMNIDHLPFNDLLFMKIYYNSKLTFFNCVFHNNTNKNYIIETRDNAVAEFINCEFRGNFLFNSYNSSIIVRN